MAHLGRTAGLAHARVGFGPGRERGFRLCPMRDRSLVTSVQKVRHGLLVGARDHVLPHALLRVPCSHRPKGPVTIRQDCTMFEAGRLLHLSPSAKYMNGKREGGNIWSGLGGG